VTAIELCNGLLSALKAETNPDMHYRGSTVHAAPLPSHVIRRWDQRLQAWEALRWTLSSRTLLDWVEGEVQACSEQAGRPRAARPWLQALLCPSSALGRASPKALAIELLLMGRSLFGVGRH
jgi:hypothetical protein